MAERKTAAQNLRIAEIFDELADLLEIEGANPFRVRAYRNAARVVASYPRTLSEVIEQGEPLPKIAGVGKDLAGKIEEIVTSGKLSVLDETARRIPTGLRELLRIPGLGPKRARILQQKLGISGEKDLEKAVHQGKVRELRGFGEKTERNILDLLSRKKGIAKRFPYLSAEQSAAAILEFLKELPEVEQAIVAGSLRRRRETVGDVDILVTCKSPETVMDHFVRHPDVRDIVSHGDKRSTVLLRNGLQVDVRVVAKESYGAALVYFTGSKAHNIAIRVIAIRKGFKLNEYGVFRGSRRIAGKTEEEVYAKIDLPWIEPELREDRGEVEAAQKRALPKLVELADIRGDLHSHTVATDGRASLKEMAEAAKALGYEYLAVTDHSKRLTVARGQTAERLRKQIRQIDQLNGRLQGITLLKSAEVDILEDGSLDLPDDILRELDLTVCSVHYQLRLPRQKQTERILRAMDHWAFRILGHPTGRLIDQREPFSVDMDRLIAEARHRGRILELNSQPDRLDLNDVFCKAAKDAGVLISLATDAHSMGDLSWMRLGIYQARRGWLEPKDVVNTRSLPQLRKVLGRR